MTTQARSGPLATLRGIWQHNHELLRNAGSLFVTTGLSSLFGFVYWIVAAREFSQQAVGYGSATVSAMTLLGTIGMFGLGTMLLGELPRLKSRGGLFAATLIVSGVGSLILGFAFPPVAQAFGAHFPTIIGTPGRLVLFAVGVAASGATMVLDEGTIGLLRGGVVLTRNLVMSVIKLIALPVAAVVLHDAFGVGLELTWVLGTLLSLLPAALMLRRGGSRILHRPDWVQLRKLGKVAAAHNWLNLALQTPPRIIPVLVTIVVSPSANAAFYIAWMLVNFLFMLPASLSTVLFAIASAAPEVIAEKLRFVLRLSVVIGLPAMVLLAVCANFALGLFGANYAHTATIPLLLLIVTYIPELPKSQYIAVCRATNKVTKAALVLTIAAFAELGAVVIGGKLGGLDGLTFGYLCVTIIEGIVTAPTVLRAAYNRGQQRRAATEGVATIPAAADVADRVPAGSGYLRGQQLGLATLITLASAAVSQGHNLDTAVAVWRTGSVPGLPLADGPGLRAATEATRADLLSGRSVGPISGRPAYRRHQQAGLDALIALATPASSDAYLQRTRANAHLQETSSKE
jgi:O-antigen/teichoic acid export membrane protein